MLLGFATECVFAQSAEEEVLQENITESVLTNSDDVEELFTPIDINEASLDDLLALPGIDEACATSIVAYRAKVGSIRRIEELSRIEGMTPELLAALAKRLKVSGGSGLRVDAASYFSILPQRVSLYNERGDYGISNFQRFELTYGSFGAYALTDKDPGENSYADFYSFAFAARDIGPFTAINAGDYSMSLGNGLLFSSGGMVSKSAGAITPLFTNRAYALKPYRSRGENKFLRGGALGVCIGDLTLTAFASSKNLLARVDDSGRVTSVDYSGLHIPSASTDSRRNLSERITGGIVHYDTPTLVAGAAAVYFLYDRTFAGYYERETLALETFSRFRSENLAFSGEILFDRLVSFSTNVGLDFGDARFAFGMRSLRSRLVQNYSGALSESFPTAPERGVYFGASLRPADIVKLGFYYDRFRIISITGEPDRNGEEVFVDSYISLPGKEFFEGGNTLLYVRYKYKTKEDAYIPFADFPVALSVIAGSKQNFRIDFRHRIGASYAFRIRTEWNFVSSGERGDMFLIDSGWRFGDGSIDARICFYRTDSYKSAFYTLEKDLPRIMGLNLFYGDGARLFLLGSLKMSRHLEGGLKISRDIYSGSREIAVGSESKALSGQTEFSMEIIYTIE